MIINLSSPVAALPLSGGTLTGNLTLPGGATALTFAAAATIVAAAGLTMPAITLGGNITGGGKVISALDRQLYNETNLLLNGSFEVGDPPTGWTWGAGLLSWSNTQVKIGSYSGKLVSELNASAYYYQIPSTFAYFKGKTVTMGCWVYATEANRARLGIWDGVSDSWGSYHSGGGSWEWLTITKLLVTDATDLRATIFIYGGSVITAYFDGAIMVEGDSCPAFSPKPVDDTDPRFGTYTAGAATDSTGYITIKDAGGTARKVMIQA